jgi:hypothetical protein
MTYQAAQALMSQVQPQSYNSGYNCLRNDSPKVLPITADFTQAGALAAGYTVDFQNLLQQGNIHSIQTVFIDNSQNNGFVTVINPDYNQKIVLAPGLQGFFPVMAGKLNAASFNITSTSASIVNLEFFNVMIPPLQWSGSVAPLAAGIAVIATPPQYIATDYSGTITAGGTAQLLMPLNSARHGWSIQNIDGVNTGEAIWYSLTGTAQINLPGSYSLAAGQSIAFPGGYGQGLTSNAISIIAATTGHKFTATSW